LWRGLASSEGRGYQPPVFDIHAAGRESTPNAACIDRQSVNTTEVGGEQRSYDDGKKIKGRNRLLLVDTLGLLIAVSISAANVDDSRRVTPRL